MPRKPTHRTQRSRSRPVIRLTLWLVALLGVATALYAGYLDQRIRTRFEGRRWAVPSRVYARPLELFPGADLTAANLVRELESLGYRPDPALARPGTYHRDGTALLLRTRGFAFGDGEEPPHRLRAQFSGGRLQTLTEPRTDAPRSLARLEPAEIGRFYPEHREDRELVRLEDVPAVLPAALVAVEDRSFETHPGIDPRAVLRALVANLRAGKVVQGGSTLTQQLVKNYFLTSERSLWRKLTEALMALLLEIHYDKPEILEAYLNEVYYGQQAERAIHGVGLASRHYFGRTVGELDLAQIALLVGLVQGPSHFDPRRHPERALGRRNRVLDILAERGLVTADAATAARKTPLGVTPDPPAGVSRHPAFLDLVLRQLRRDYREADLRSAGLRVFSTLDPRFQEAAEEALAGRLRALESTGGPASGTLQGAAVVTRPQTGDVLALVGGRDPRFPGFNRALDAARPIGSLVKPAVYLTALEQAGAYTLATRIEDEDLRLDLGGGEPWVPANADRRSHGSVTLYRALTQSYNLATARLGLELGVERVLETLRRLGLEQTVSAYPSLLLGALELSPVSVAQLYVPLANGGFRTPLRAIREVVDADGRPLSRYPLQVTQVIDPEPLALLDSALRGVVTEGTAVTLRQHLPPSLGAVGAVAGKTGTTDGLRDSWFAGYTGDWLGVVWVGLDDNRPAGLTGAGGAMVAWGDLAARVGGRPLSEVLPAGIETAWVDRDSGQPAAAGSQGALLLPFVKGTVPATPPRPGLLRRLGGWLRGDEP